MLDSLYSETTSYTHSAAHSGPTPSLDENTTPAHTTAEALLPNTRPHERVVQVNEDHTVELLTDEHDPSSPPTPHAMPDETANSPEARPIEPEAPIHSNTPTLGPSAMLAGLAVPATDTIERFAGEDDGSSYDMQKAASEAGEDYTELTRSWMAAASAESTQHVVGN